MNEKPTSSSKPSSPKSHKKPHSRRSSIQESTSHKTPQSGESSKHSQPKQVKTVSSKKSKHEVSVTIFSTETSFFFTIKVIQKFVFIKKVKKSQPKSSGLRVRSLKKNMWI